VGLSAFPLFLYTALTAWCAAGEFRDRCGLFFSFHDCGASPFPVAACLSRIVFTRQFNTSLGMCVSLPALQPIPTNVGFRFRFPISLLLAPLDCLVAGVILICERRFLVRMLHGNNEYAEPHQV
jgi:hypothetical protein